MSWKFPARNIKNPEVISMDDINENFREVVEEATGALNEHNWKTAAFANRDQLADNAGIELHRVRISANPNTDPGVTANIQVINLDRDWQELNGTEVTFNSTGGTVWIMASIQASSPLDLSWFTTGGANGRFGLQFALSLNGAVLAQSIIGGADLSNDQISTFRPPSPPLIGFSCINSPAPSSLFFSIVSEAIVDVPPGKHTVRVVSAPPKASDYSGATLANKAKWVGSRELIVLELLR